MKLKILSSSPCTQPWEAMRGNARERHCEACDKQVYNFAAMTKRQIEELVRDRKGQLCARILFRTDGSLRTKDGVSHSSVAAGLLLAGSLMLPSTLQSQSPSVQGGATAHLSGQILKPDGSSPISGAFVALLSNHQIVASAHTDAHGTFEITAPSGTYDIAFGSSPSDTVRIVGYDLQPGEQKLDALPIMPQQTTTVTVEANSDDLRLVGALSAVIGRPPFFWYFFQHPIRYVKSLRHTS